jgi:scyllo-inositol 2-dehydrogenase (NADP+)
LPHTIFNLKIENQAIKNNHRKNMKKPNVVVVGFGFAGRCFHTYLVNITQELNLYGVVTSRKQSREIAKASYHKLKTYNCYDDAIKDKNVDVVILATPNNLHAAQAIQAMRFGKHVITDKPMCLTLAEADAMIETSLRYDRLLSVFQNRRWDGDFLTIKNAISSNLLGDPYIMELFWGQYGEPSGWRSQTSNGGGKFFDLGAHLIDQALQLIDSQPTLVYANFHSPDTWSLDIEAHATATIIFANGVEARIETSSIAESPKPRWRIFGTLGTLIKEGIDPQEQAMIAGNIDASEENPRNRAIFHPNSSTHSEKILDTIPGRWRSFYENISRAIENRDELVVTPESCRQIIAIIEAARTSAFTGEIVKVK